MVEIIFVGLLLPIAGLLWQLFREQKHHQQQMVDAYLEFEAEKDAQISSFSRTISELNLIIDRQDVELRENENSIQEIGDSFTTEIADLEAQLRATNTRWEMALETAEKFANELSELREAHANCLPVLYAGKTTP